MNKARRLLKRGADYGTGAGLIERGQSLNDSYVRRAHQSAIRR